MDIYVAGPVIVSNEAIAVNAPEVVTPAVTATD
jgi:hypothetical protein